jgi:hypothetical protein
LNQHSIGIVTPDKVSINMIKRSESSSTGASSGALLPNQATNVWTMGVSTDDVSALCTFIRDGQDLLRILTTKATTQETAVMGVSAINRIGRLKDRKIGQSKMPNLTIRFP